MNMSQKSAPFITKISIKNYRIFQQKRNMVRQTKLKLPEDYPNPWPYKEEGYCYWTHGWNYLDRTLPRFHQNSKLITVEGNIGSGKDSVGKQIANAFDLHYMREFRMDDIFIDRYGNDFRNFYHLFPKRFRVPDFNMFYKNPFDDLSAVMQDRIYECRWEQYLNALAHIFNTGQGVVMKRPVHTDFIFANAMRDKNFIGPEYFKFYYFIRKLTLRHLELWPHVVIYLDCPIWKCLENIKKRGNEHEIKVVDERYLKVIEESYKDALRELKKQSKVLVYDWTDPDPDIIETIVEDIEKLEMDFYEWDLGEIWESWLTIGDELPHKIMRWRVTDKYDVRCDAWAHDVAKHEVGELCIYPMDYYHYDNVIKHKILKSRYSYGYQKHDPIQSTGFRREDNSLPEKWFEYFWKELWYDMYVTPQNWLDPLGKEYNPDYLHGH